MTQTPRSVLGISATSPRPTFRGALWLACSLSLHALPVLLLAEALWRWLA